MRLKIVGYGEMSMGWLWRLVREGWVDSDHRAPYPRSTVAAMGYCRGDGRQRSPQSGKPLPPEVSRKNLQSPVTHATDAGVQLVLIDRHDPDL